MAHGREAVRAVVTHSFDTTLAALGTAALLGLMSGWMSRPSKTRYSLPSDFGCAGVLFATLAILLACGMLLGRALL